MHNTFNESNSLALRKLNLPEQHISSTYKFPAINFDTRKAEVLNSLSMKIMAKEKDVNDIL